MQAAESWISRLSGLSLHSMSSIECDGIDKLAMFAFSDGDEMNEVAIHLGDGPRYCLPVLHRTRL